MLKTTMTTTTAHASFMKDFMKRQEEREQKEQEFFCNVAAALANGILTPEHVCSMIEVLRDSKIFPDDILDPEDQAQEQQKGFNEIAGVYADWKITKEEACECFVEWNDDWKKIRSQCATEPMRN
jgi:leucyl aminopeptidase